MFSSVLGRLVVVAVAVGTLSCQAAEAQAARTVPVTRCPTTTGVSGPVGPTPARLSVRGATHGLVAYTNSDEYLLAPSSMHCAGQIGGDGSAVLVVWLAARPGFHSRHAGLTLVVIPACVGCKAEQICPFFPAYARRLAFPCNTAVPPGERVTRRRTHALFEDPPGVAGDGWPSGGADPSIGVVGYTNAPYQGIVYRATCTLPSRERDVCAVSLNDVIGRYG